MAKQSSDFGFPQPFVSDTLLVVEDDDFIRELFSITIESETPYHVRLFPGGRAAIQSIEEIVALRPLLFILDYALPGMTGIELYDLLHGIPALRSVPAIITTARYLNETISQALIERKITFLEKPFEIEELLQSIEQLVR